MPEVFAISSTVPVSIISAPPEIVKFFARSLWIECANIEGRTIHAQDEFSYFCTPLLNSGGTTFILNMTGFVYSEEELRQIRREREEDARRAEEYGHWSQQLQRVLQEQLDYYGAPLWRISESERRRDSQVEQLLGEIVEQDERRQIVSEQYARQQIAEQERRIDAGRPRRSIDELLADIDEQTRRPSENGVDGGTASQMNAGEKGKIRYMDREGNWQEEEQIFL